MRYKLPSSVRDSLAKKESRLHHLLWHAIRDSWHDFSESERETMQQAHPGWVPNIPRFTRVTPTSSNPNGIEINWDAGESFLYMHRRMIQDVNVQLLALGESSLVPWPSIPELDDPLYPVPNRRANGPDNDPKSDAHLEIMKARAAWVRDPATLQNNSLARIGAYIESAIHDFMHGRWEELPDVMDDFPELTPTNVNPEIEDKFNHPSVDYLGHPYSSHVNSVFWKLHGWIDEIIDMWRTASGVDTFEWTDTWSGDYPVRTQPEFVSGIQPLVNLERMHNRFSSGHHSWDTMLEVFRTINSFNKCHASFDYIKEMNIPIPEL
ncbi:MAG: hypothetical protein OXI15_13180 [Chromatiales bacterium]|nr:hypothetical protein [Chromatiales bacterium]